MNLNKIWLIFLFTTFLLIEAPIYTQFYFFLHYSKMADGFDPCECVWNHEHAMQRLINLVSMYMIAML